VSKNIARFLHAQDPGFVVVSTFRRLGKGIGACNFDPDALVDDASCFFLPGEFSGDGIVGAADVLAMLNACGFSCD